LRHPHAYKAWFVLLNCRWVFHHHHLNCPWINESAPREEVNDEMGFSFIQINEDIDEKEEDEGDEEAEWDDGNETNEVEEYLHLYNDENDDDDVDDDDDINDCLLMNCYVFQ